MSSRKGLPVDLKMRHDSHYVDELARTNRSIGRKISINLLEPNPEQPRVEIGDLTELSSSIKQKGVLEPILVKPDSKRGTWMIIAGERRWRAAALAGLTEVPCIELDIDEKDVAEIALIENLQRKDLTIWEEADGFAYLIEKFGYTHDEIAGKIGKSRPTVTEYLTIAGLPEPIRAKCRQAKITAKSALLEVARQFDEPAMHDFLDRSNGSTGNQLTGKSNAFRAAGKKVKSNLSESDTESVPEKTSKNIFKYDSDDKLFYLELRFNKKENFTKDDVLGALKQAFGQIKSQPQSDKSKVGGK